MDKKVKEAVDLFTEVMIYGTERVIRAVDDPLWKEFSPEQLQMLKLIGKEGRITSSRLAILQGVHKSAVSSRIKKMLQKEMVLVVQSEDRREKLIELTDKGKETVAKTDKVLTEYLEKLISQKVEDHEVEQFLKIMRKLKSIIKADGVY